MKCNFNDLGSNNHNNKTKNVIFFDQFGLSFRQKSAIYCLCTNGDPGPFSARSPGPPEHWIFIHDKICYIWHLSVYGKNLACTLKDYIELQMFESEITYFPSISILDYESCEMHNG